MWTKKIACIAVLFLLTISAYSQIVNDQDELSAAISGASPGTTIILADGTWNNTFIDISKSGTAAEPIMITAQNPGAVLMTGNSRVYMKGTYLTVSGLVFEEPANLIVNDAGTRIEPVFELDECNNCKVINNIIDNYNGTEDQKTLIFKWILNDGQYNEIAYNSFLGKYGIGSIINDNRNSPEPDYLQIHHNYFADRTPINELNEDNDQDAIRMGSSTNSLDDSFSEVYDNYFYNFAGEIEVISNKSGQNKYYNNTFRDYSGTLTLRHGDNCEVYGNYFFAENNLMSGGVRVIGEGHKVYNNYIEGVNSVKPDGSTSNATGGINVTNGRLDSELNGYYQVKNAQIVNNTFVNCDYGLRIGTTVNDDLDQEPENLTVANNILYNTSIDAYLVETAPSGSSISEGNITDLTDGNLVDDGNFHRLTSESVAVDAAVGTYTFLTQDILLGNREAAVDAGAEEFGANGTKLPYTDADVGVNVGFGSALSPNLSISPSMLTFSLEAESLTFDIISNVNWEITEDIPWLSLDTNTGTGTTTVTATVTENTTGEERTGSISLNEVAGGSDLSAVLPVIQLNTFVASEIQIVGTTSEGMQIKDEVSEENAYNDDNTNYWTGNPDTAAVVSITFDLECNHTLTEIGINFWKADERTTTFSIEVAENAAGPFTNVLDNVSSTSIDATVDTEQFFSLNNVIARYVKFIGIGNSSASSNWTSIANVNIYGGNPEEDCVTSIFNPSISQNVQLFPVPVTDGLLNIESDTKALNLIEVYSITGQKILTTNGNGSYTKQVDVRGLRAGIYFVKLVGIGSTKFIVQ